MSCSIVFIHWGGESERESVSWPDDTMAGSRTVRSGAPLLLHPATHEKQISQLMKKNMQPLKVIIKSLYKYS